MLPSSRLESTYKELKHLNVLEACIEKYRLESTYKELKLYYGG